MPKRTNADIRSDIDRERSALVGEIQGLRQDVAGVLPYAIGAALAAAFVTRSKSARTALKVLWWLR